MTFNPAVVRCALSLKRRCCSVLWNGTDQHSGGCKFSSTPEAQLVLSWERSVQAKTHRKRPWTWLSLKLQRCECRYEWGSFPWSCAAPLMLRRECWLPEELRLRERTPTLYLWSRQTANWGLFVWGAESNPSKSSLNTMSDARALWLWSSAERPAVRESQPGARARAGPKAWCWGGLRQGQLHPSGPSPLLLILSIRHSEN